MATTVYYGQAQIYNALTREWDEEVAYDQSGTDVIGTRIKMRFVGYVHAQSIGIGGNARTKTVKTGGSPSTIVEAYADVKGIFEEARKTLVIIVGEDRLATPAVAGKEIFRCEPPDGDKRSNVNRDIDNGPKPRGFNIVKVVNDQILQVEWSVEVMKLHCDSNRGPGEVLNNRWAITEEADVNWFTTRTIRGRLRLSASNYSPASAYRFIVTPGLERGFRRERVEYAVAENGLEVEYQVTDRQVHDAAPSPATRMSGSFTTSTDQGFDFVSSVRVRLEGPPHVDKRLLISRALQIVDNRLTFNAKRTGNKAFLMNATITDVFGEENACEVSYTIRETPADIGDFLSNLRLDVLGTPLSLPDYASNTSQQPKLYGYNPYGSERSPAYLFLLHCYLQSPCEADHEIRGFPQVPGANADGQSAEETGTQFIAVTSLPAIEAVLVSADQKRLGPGAYTFARAEVTYKVRPCRAHLPIAVKVEYNGQGTDDTSVFIDLAPGLATREITVDYERLGELPKIPSPLDSYTDGAIRGKLLEFIPSPLPPTLGADGRTALYRIRAYYRWGLNRIPRADEALKTSVLPFTSFGIEDSKISGTALYDPTIGP